MQGTEPVQLIPLLALLLCTGVLVAYAVRVARGGRAAHPRLGPSPGSALLPGWLVEAFYWALHLPGRALGRWGVEPDRITYLSLVVSAGSLPLAATGRFAPAAALVLLGGALDGLDGMVARARGRASPAGAVLDSFVDRLSDAAPLVGLALFYRERALTLAVPLLALVASSLVSYARAKADIYALTLPNGLMRRHERVVYVAVALLVAPLAPRAELGGGVAYPVTLAVVLLLGVVGLVAAVVLVGRTREALVQASRRREGAATEPKPPRVSAAPQTTVL